MTINLKLTLHQSTVQPQLSRRIGKPLNVQITGNLDVILFFFLGSTVYWRCALKLWCFNRNASMYVGNQLNNCVIWQEQVSYTSELCRDFIDSIVCIGIVVLYAKAL